MPKLLAMRVEESTLTEGTGTLTLAGVVSGDTRTFGAAFADGDRVWYCILWGNHWEYGLGTFLESPDQLQRDLCLRSTVNDAKLSLGAGTKIVYCELIPENFPTGYLFFADGDTTPSVKNARFFVAANSSPTTIVTFDDGAPGQEIIILGFNGNTTINHGSEIKHPGALNLTLGQHDVVHYVRGTFGGNNVWNRVNYSDNA